MDPLQYLLSLEKFGIKFGLDNIRVLCEALGNPHTQYPSVLIAGTNGKGSVTAMVDRAARAAGLKSGRYTSPHLVRLEERFAIDGRPVQTSELLAAIERVRELIDTLITSGTLDAPPTFFEVTTAIAFELFRNAAIDIAVLEVGLGGRLDSTNIARPVACAITSIAFDHQQHLGNTLAEIAAEKAGIIKPATPCVIGPLPSEARAVVEARCAEAGAELIDATVRSTVDSRPAPDGRTAIHLDTPRRTYGWNVLGLRGAHQIPNAIVAVSLLEQMEHSLSISPAAIRSGITDVSWPGRLQMVEVSGQRVLLDAAHNPAGAAALVEYLLTHFTTPMPIVFGAMRDKDAEQMIEILAAAASVFVLTQPGNVRSRGAGELAEIARARFPSTPAFVEPEPRAALARAWTHGPIICAAGSIFLIGDLLESLMLSFEGLPISRG